MASAVSEKIKEKRNRVSTHTHHNNINSFFRINVKVVILQIGFYDSTFAIAFFSSPSKSICRLNTFYLQSV